MENLCALHIAKWKIDSKRSEISSTQRSLWQEIGSNRSPQVPTYEETGIWKGVIVVGIILVIVSWLDIFLISFLAGVVGWISLVGGIYFLSSTNKENKKRKQEYTYLYSNYYTRMRELKKKDDEYNTYAFVQYSLHEAETKKIDAALQVAYNANVIPRRYRDIYVAVYLYDWFSTSMADDLDMALNMYVLEEIKDKLDNIINMLAKSLVNQRIIIEDQQKYMEKQERYHQEMLNKLDRMQLTAEEHSRYLGMIEANTAATAYFAAAEYIRKI